MIKNYLIEFPCEEFTLFHSVQTDDNGSGQCHTPEDGSGDREKFMKPILICIFELQILKCLEYACESRSRYNSRVFLPRPWRYGGQGFLCVPFLIPDKGRVSLMLDLPFSNLG